uniref:Uncharacterized protein n=1 Tax=Anguilla anguilla TaxID=7936 RepID=A0A0E9V5X3_ANGAN
MFPPDLDSFIGFFSIGSYGVLVEGRRAFSEKIGGLTQRKKFS